MLAFAGIGLSGLALLLNIVGLAIPYWIYDSKEYLGITLKSYSGLWTSCRTSGTETLCDSFPSEWLTGAFKGARACEILGVLVIAGALVCAVLKQFVMKEQKLLPKIGGGCAIAAGALMIIGTIIYATQDGIVSSNLHAGFALCIVAGVIAIIAGIIMFLASKDE